MSRFSLQKALRRLRHRAVQTSSRHKKPLLVVTLFILVVLWIKSDRRLSYHIDACDIEEQERIVRAPDGVEICKYLPATKGRYRDTKYGMSKLSSFHDLCPDCDIQLSTNQIYCPDVRLRGETMVRQSQLALVRMLVHLDHVMRKQGAHYWLMDGGLMAAVTGGGYFLSNEWQLTIGITEQAFNHVTPALHNELPDRMTFVTNTDSAFDMGHKHYRQPSISIPSASVRDDDSCTGFCLRNNCPSTSTSTRHDGLPIHIIVFGPSSDGAHQIEVKGGLLKLDTATLFPLKALKFEGRMVPVPNQPDKVLAAVYGKRYLDHDATSCPPPYSPNPWFSCQEIKESPWRSAYMQTMRLHRSY